MREIIFWTLPWGVLLLSGALTIDAWQDAKAKTERVRIAYFDSLVRETAEAIRDRLDSYRDANLGGAGLFNASEEVTGDEWREFQVRLDLSRRHHGAQGIGFAARVRHDPPHIVAEAGVSDVDDAVDATHLPLSESWVISHGHLGAREDIEGFDVAAVAELRKAMVRARDTGRTSLSQRVVFDRGGESVVAFVLFTPVYRNGRIPETQKQRADELEGWVYAPFIAEPFVRGLLETLLRERDPLIDLALFSSAEADPSFLLYDELSQSGDTRPERLEGGRYSGYGQIDLYGESWTVMVTGAQPDAFYDHRREAWAVLAAGSVTSLLLFGVVMTLNRRRMQAMALASAMTDDLVARAHELRQSNEDLGLARDRAERSADALLAQHESLARAERLAALGEMAAGMAHELRNPIAGMMTSVENMARETDDDGLGERLRSVSGELQRLTRLLNAYLSPVRHAPEPRRDVDVVAMVDELCTLVRFRLPPGIELVTRMTGPLHWSLPTDRVRQALLNLLLNAQQAMTGATGGQARAGRIEIRAEIRGRELELAVLDEGPGFPDAYLAGTNQPFQTSKQGGTGLGLAMVRRLARDLDGRVELRNRAEGGAEAHLVLPSPEAA